MVAASEVVVCGGVSFYIILYRHIGDKGSMSCICNGLLVYRNVAVDFCSHPVRGLCLNCASTMLSFVRGWIY